MTIRVDCEAVEPIETARGGMAGRLSHEARQRLDGRVEFDDEVSIRHQTTGSQSYIMLRACRVVVDQPLALSRRTCMSQPTSLPTRSCPDYRLAHVLRQRRTHDYRCYPSTLAKVGRVL